MAIKSDILAQKLARPPRQPRSGPVVSEDGATHYRVFDEPGVVLSSVSESEPKSEEPIIDPLPQFLEEQVVITAHNDVVSQELINEPTIQPMIDEANLLEVELMLSGIASTFFVYLMERVIDDSGITAPIVIEECQKHSSLNLTSLRKAIQRLEKKGIIERFKVKYGRGGWTQYKICNYSHLKNILQTNK